MENIGIPVGNFLSAEELAERQYQQKKKEIKIARIRASVLRKQITEAYDILENIRFDYLGDTAFREKIVRAKQGLEEAMCDFLLDDTYWKDRLERHYKLTPEEYDKTVKVNGCTTGTSLVG